MKRQRSNKNNNSITSKSIQSKKAVAIKERELGWDSSVVREIPPYDSETDPNCPRAVVRHFNKTKKENAIDRARKGRGASDWIENTIKKKFDDIPVKEAPTLREKAAAAAVREESLTEVEILQKIIVRENLVTELEKLLKYQVDIDSVLSEAAELVKAIRFQTLDVVEEIYAWKMDMKAPRQFYYRGKNYLLKLMNDTAFLDEYDDLGDYFGFYFSGNPLMYDGVPLEEPPEGGVKSIASSFSDKLVDGIPERRLHAAESIILKEVATYEERADSADGTVSATQSQHRGSSVDHFPLQVGERNMATDSIVENSISLMEGDERHMSSTMPAGGRKDSVMNGRGAATVSQVPASSYLEGSHSREKLPDKKRRKDGSIKPVKVRNELKVKKGRVKTLRNEVDEVRAMQAHVEDQCAAVVHDHTELTKKLAALEKKRAEAVFLDKTALVQKLNIEISIAEGEILNKAMQLKDLQRQKYFLDQEISRRRGLIRVLENEINDATTKTVVKNRLLKKAKKEGIMSALLSTESAVAEAEKRRTKKALDDSSTVSSFDVPQSSSKKFTDSIEEATTDDHSDEDRDVGKGEHAAGSFDGTGLDSPESQHSVFGFDSLDSALTFEDLGTASLERDNASANQTGADSGQWEWHNPAVDGELVVNDVHVEASQCANSVISNSLEMLWFIMVAAEDVRPRKIAVRGFVRQQLENGVSSVVLTKDCAWDLVGKCLWEGYNNATESIVEADIARARREVATLCTAKVLTVAQNIIVSNVVAEQERQIRVRNALATQIAIDSISTWSEDCVASVAVKQCVSSQLAVAVATDSINSTLTKILENLEPVMIPFDAFCDMCEEATVGSIGAALYTVEAKVVKVQRALARARRAAVEGEVCGTIAVGTGFVLAKARKSYRESMANMSTLDSSINSQLSPSSVNTMSESVLSKQKNIDQQKEESSSATGYGDISRQLNTTEDGISVISNDPDSVDGGNKCPKPMGELQLYNFETKETISHKFVSETEQVYTSVVEAFEDATRSTGSVDQVIYGKKLETLHKAGMVINRRSYLVQMIQEEKGIKLDCLHITDGNVITVRLTKKQEKDLEDTRNPTEFMKKVLTSSALMR
mmetsp:Transcript_22502/g.32860  ORF Transcript_22502/g.32860 Transcript_22502/m.32860 type:complete len:1106 (-) Transcript_22502:82-3399(-)